MAGHLVCTMPRDETSDELVDALARIKQWCDAYPEKIFRPVSSEKMKVAASVLREHDIDIGAMHADWARHLLAGISGIANAALAPAQAGEANNNPPKAAGALTAEKAATVEIVARILCLLDREMTNQYDGAADLAAHVNETWGDWKEDATNALETVLAWQKATGGDTRGVSALPPSSARERRMRESLEAFSALSRRMQIDDETWAIVQDWPEWSAAMQAFTEYRALSSDGRGREKGNTSNSDDGIDPAPPATNRSA